jgi:hypothetical protein
MMMCNIGWWYICNREVSQIEVKYKRTLEAMMLYVQGKSYVMPMTRNGPYV